MTPATGFDVDEKLGVRLIPLAGLPRVYRDYPPPRSLRDFPQQFEW